MTTSGFFYRAMGTLIVILIAVAIVFGIIPGKMTDEQTVVIAVLVAGCFLTLIIGIIATIWDN